MVQLGSPDKSLQIAGCRDTCGYGSQWFCCVLGSPCLNHRWFIETLDIRRKNVPWIFWPAVLPNLCFWLLNASPSGCPVCPSLEDTPCCTSATRWTLGQDKNGSGEVDMWFDFSETAAVLSTCLSSETLEGGERAEYVLSSQFIVTLATSLSCSHCCSKSLRVEGACRMERAASIWPVCVWRGMRGGAGKQQFPSGIVKSGRSCQEMWRLSRSDRAQAWAAAGACEPGGRVAYIAHPPTEGPEFNVSLK